MFNLYSKALYLRAVDILDNPLRYSEEELEAMDWRPLQESLTPKLMLDLFGQEYKDTWETMMKEQLEANPEETKRALKAAKFMTERLKAIKATGREITEHDIRSVQESVSISRHVLNPPLSV